jgi:hypothetical protein
MNRAVAGKRMVITLLAGLNVLLAVMLVAQVASLPGAYGQVGGRAGDFISVTAEAGGRDYDVLYLLDVSGRKLYGFYPGNLQTRRLSEVPPRDLAADFGRE